MGISKNEIESIVVGVLSVNRYGLEKAYALLPALENGGLLDSELVAAMDIEDLIIGLEAAGYRRGRLMTKMASRYLALMLAVKSGDLDSFGDLLRSGETEMAADLLCKVWGIGPSVAHSAILLIRS